MRFIKKFDSFLIKEAAGLAEATLIYSDYIMSLINTHFDSFINSNLQKYNKKEIIDLKSVKQIINDPKWIDMPVSSIEITFDFVIKNSLDFAKEFPVTSKLKEFTTTGSCFSIQQEKGEDSSYFVEPIDERTDHSIHLGLEIGCIMTDKLDEYDELFLELEATVLHELNHAYEGYRRFLSGAGQLSTDVTWALEANRSRIKKEIFKIWKKEIGYTVYWSEKHEMNAMVQESWPYVKKYEPTELKDKCPSWRFAQEMKNFDASKVKKLLVDEILKHYPDVNPNILLNRMKNGFANELSKERQESVLASEEAPSLSGEKIRNMNFDKFLSTMQKRINLAGERIQSKILRLYSLKK